jgi:hypothetical protein
MIIRPKAAFGAPAEFDAAWRRRRRYERAGLECAGLHRLREQKAAVEAYAERLLLIHGRHERMNGQPRLWGPCELQPGP